MVPWTENETVPFIIVDHTLLRVQDSEGKNIRKIRLIFRITFEKIRIFPNDLETYSEKICKVLKKLCSCVLLPCHCRFSLGHAAWWISSHTVSTPLSFYMISLQSIENQRRLFKCLSVQGIHKTIVYVGSVNSWDSCRFLEFIHTIGSVNS